MPLAPTPASPAARRSRPAARPAVSFLLALAALVLAPACSRQSGDAFPVQTYLDSPETLLGNRYSLDAEIDAQLDWREGVGRIVAVRPLPATRDAARLPLFIADSHQANLMVAQRYRLELTVRRGGLLYVTALKKL